MSRTQLADSTATTSDCHPIKSKILQANKFVRTAMQWGLGGFFLVGDLGLGFFFFLFIFVYFFNSILFKCFWVKSAFGLNYR